MVNITPVIAKAMSYAFDTYTRLCYFNKTSRHDSEGKVIRQADN